MKVKRIVSNIYAPNPEKAQAFYREILGLELLMDMGWILTFGASTKMSSQITVASTGGSYAPVPDVTIEVDDLEQARKRIEAAGIDIEYGPVLEPWGVRRFFVRDPFGKLINILTHE
jgi:catechol 2,3-dioxygenase-like lactoylglutathione lyase family enzyme